MRFHGLLSDDMGTLVNQDNQFLFSFFNIDRAFDFLLSIGMKPLVELSFMPATLSSDGNSVFHYRANVTPPRRMEDWQLLMTKLVGHWVERYGIDEVAQWPLEVWNEPNLTAFWTGGQAKYFELFKATWTSIKAISPRLQVGGPATAGNAWLDDFNAFCAANACPPDFISTHYYPTDAFGSIDTDTVSQLRDAPMSVMRDRAREARAAAGAKPLYYTEWNITSNPRDPMHDGPFCAALATHFLLSVDDLVDAYSWWVFTDIFEENYFPSIPYHGGFGLMNLYGVPKPVYRAFQMLDQLGTRRWDVAGTHATVSAHAGAPDDDGRHHAAADQRGDAAAPHRHRGRDDAGGRRDGPQAARGAGLAHRRHARQPAGRVAADGQSGIPPPASSGRARSRVDCRARTPRRAGRRRRRALHAGPARQRDGAGAHRVGGGMSDARPPEGARTAARRAEVSR